MKGFTSQEGIMETEVMGRVLTEATMENLRDLWSVESGQKDAHEARKITVLDALVDTGATLLSLPTRIVRELGLRPMYTRKVTCSNGITEATVYEAVRLTIQGRYCTMDVMEVPDAVPVLIGQLPLEHLDFVVDLRSRSLIGNPAHGGEHMFEAY